MQRIKMGFNTPTRRYELSADSAIVKRPHRETFFRTEVKLSDITGQEIFVLDGNLFISGGSTLPLSEVLDRMAQVMEHAEATFPNDFAS